MPDTEDFARSSAPDVPPISSNERPQPDRARLTASILRFITDRGRDDADFVQAIADAATIWFQVRARVYRRTLSGRMELHDAWRDAVTPEQRQIRRDLLPQLEVGVARRVRAAKWTWPDGDTYVTAVGTAPLWLIMVNGRRGARDAAEVFAALSGPLTSRCRALANARVLALVHRLGARISSDLPLTDVARVACIETAGATDNASVWATLKQGRSSRTLAAWRSTIKARSSLGRTDRTSPHSIIRSFPLAGSASFVLEVRREVEFDVTEVKLLEAVVSVLRTVITTVPAGELKEPESATPSRFEHRVQEEINRAKRYDLALSLVVLRAAPLKGPSADLRGIAGMLRKSLRSSDVIGQVGPGALGVLLPHTDAALAVEVMRRLQRELTGATRAPARPGFIGLATLGSDSGTPRTLIAKALREVRRAATPL